MSKLKVEIEIPDWVNWMAVDKSGDVYGYEFEPSLKMNGQMWDHVKGNLYNLYTGEPPKNWKDELYTWS